MSGKNSTEFNQTPEPVTAREKLDYTFDLSAWLAAGETVSQATAKLFLASSRAAEIAGVVSGLTIITGNKVRLTIDWSNGAIKTGTVYHLWIAATIGTQVKEAFARFSVHSQ